MESKSSNKSGAHSDAAFDNLLRSARAEVALPSNFRSEVWRRISASQEIRVSARLVCWLENRLNRLVRGYTVAAAILVTIGAGLWFGSQGGEPARDGKLAYVESVSPFARGHQGNSK